MDFLIGIALGILLVRSGADRVIWKWLSAKWEQIKPKNEPLSGRNSKTTVKDENNEVG